jgi:hypothetical protein
MEIELTANPIWISEAVLFSHTADGAASTRRGGETVNEMLDHVRSSASTGHKLQAPSRNLSRRLHSIRRFIKATCAKTFERG